MSQTINREKYSATTRAMLDLLCDEKPRPKQEVLRAGMIGGLTESYNRCVQEGKRVRRGNPAQTSEYAKAGAMAFARNSLRIAIRDKKVTLTGRTVTMLTHEAKPWKLTYDLISRPHIRDTIYKLKTGTETTYGGYPEMTGWAHSPLVARDVVHFRTNNDVSLPEMKEEFLGWDVTIGAEGTITVIGQPGDPIQQVISEWAETKNYILDGLRTMPSIIRRDLTLLPSSFLNAIVGEQHLRARGILARKHGAIAHNVFSDNEELTSAVGEWVVEFARSYDPKHGGPFGKYIAGLLKKRLVDESRMRDGRTASDARIKDYKIRQELTIKLGRAPTLTEIATAMGVTEEEMHRKRSALHVLQTMQSATPLDVGPDGPEIDKADEHANPEKDAVEKDRAAQVFKALLASSRETNKHGVETTNPVGFLITYLETWDEWTKTDLIRLAGSERYVNARIAPVKAALQQNLAIYSTSN